MRRFAILLATVGALMLVPAANAFAEGTMTVHAEGNGSGEIVGIGSYPGEPPIACSYSSPGPETGACSAEKNAAEGLEGIEFEAIPAPGSVFGGWVKKNPSFEEYSGFSCPIPAEFGGDPTYCAAYDEEFEELDWEVTAVFAVPNLKLDVEEGSGTVVSNPAGLFCSGSAPKSCETALAAGKYTLTASPAPGYLVKSWKGCDVGGVNGRQCTVTAGTSLKTVGVKFYKAFELEGSKTGGLGIMGTAPGGINCGYACTSSTALYKEGGLTVKAKPAKHFHFVEFKGGTGSAASCNGVTTPECTIASFNSDSAIKEVYAEDDKKSLSLNKEGGGQGFVKTKPTNINCGLTCTAANAEFYASETAEVTVTLGKGTGEVTWTIGAGTCTGHVLTCTVPMSANALLIAKFE